LVAVFVSGCWGYSLGLLRFFGPETFKQHQKIVNTAYLTIFGYYEIEKKAAGAAAATTTTTPTPTPPPTTTRRR
jgi:hypothetical protein